MKTPHDRLGPVEITAKWRAVARTPEWDRLWQWIIATLMEENSGPDKDMSDAASIPSQPHSEVDDADKTC